MASHRQPRALITLHSEGPLLTAVLSRPPDNLVDRSLAAELRGLCASLTEEGEVHLLILAGGGDGGAFCRGTDPSLGREAQESASATRDLLEDYRCATAVASLPFPVLAAIEGDAFDQGLELALAADLRIAGEGARFRLGHLASGLIPWDGGTQRLPRVVGPAHAMDMVMTGRTVEAAEAESMGLVNKVAPGGQALDAARETAAAILAGGPIASRYAKEVVHTGVEMTLEQGILLETDLTMILQTTKDREEGIRSFLERREPRFTGE